MDIFIIEIRMRISENIRRIIALSRPFGKKRNVAEAE